MSRLLRALPVAIVCLAGLFAGYCQPEMYGQSGVSD